MIDLLAMLGVVAVMITLALLVELRELSWVLLRAVISASAAFCVGLGTNDSWQRWVVTGFGIWGGAWLLQTVYNVLLAAGDVLVLIVTRNTRRR